MSLLSAMNRFYPIRLVDIRYASHCKQIVAQSLMLSAGDLQSDHPKTTVRWASTHSPTSSTHIQPVFANALTYGNKIAIKDEFGEYSYEQIFTGAAKISTEIAKICGSASQCKIAFLCPNSALYTLVQWACWMSGHIAVPLSNKHTAAMQDYFIKDTNATVIVTTPENEALLRPIATSNKCPMLIYNHDYATVAVKSEVTKPMDNNFNSDTTAMILYTSGTTGLPKGTAISHKALHAQVQSLVHAWKLSENDNLLHVLPLNHVHGIVNALMCPLHVGATVEMHPKFERGAVWCSLLNISRPSKNQITVFMAVPTIYSFLISEYDKLVSKKHRMVDYIRNHCSERIRLMVSGSAPLPSSVFEKWHRISGHKLLERYGMTEIGMALSNPYIVDKIRDRIPGQVGSPLPGVEVKLVSKGKTVLRAKGEYGKGFWSDVSLPVYKNSDVSNDTVAAGELYVRGANVFTEYINRKSDTEASFSTGGWFKTGDEAQYENGSFKILGRTSVDIIKTGGYKVSALDVEKQLLENIHIKDVCVVGVADLVWGQKIAALVVSDKFKDDGNRTDLDELKDWCEQNMTSYEIPTVFKFVPEVPRNSLGKVNKKEVLKTFFADASTA
ncbi:hypothetical protein HA402_005590 [Bradysia odoriphaga]|nr:hypothetical protein HA402_005590 [Bradysia odoriphaga]